MMFWNPTPFPLRAWWTSPQLQLPFIWRLAAHVAGATSTTARGVEDALIQFDGETGLLENCLGDPGCGVFFSGHPSDIIWIQMWI